MMFLRRKASADQPGNLKALRAAHQQLLRDYSQLEADIAEANAETTISLAAMKEAHGRQLAEMRQHIERTRLEKVELRGKLDAAHIVNIRLGGELADKQGELERALEQVKKLDGELVSTAAELVEVSGRLADAEERLLAYEAVR